MNESCILMETNPPTDSLRTSKTLLVGLCDGHNNRSWAKFYELYHHFVFSIVRRSGLPAAEIDGVVQDVFVRVSQTIQTFESDPARGTFRGWLAQLTRWRIKDRARAIRQYADRHPDLHVPAGGETTSTDTDPIETIADTSSKEIEDTEAEWQRLVLDLAMKRLALTVPAKHYQIFDFYAVRDWSVLRVANELGVNPATVYVVSHRLKKKLRAEVEKLKTEIN